MDWFLLILGLSICTAVLLAILWSIYVPDRRVWPPDTYDKSTALLVWGATAGLASCIVVPAFLQWGAVDWLPDWVRFGIGLPLILVGNLGVWSEVARFGISQTGGAQGTAKNAGALRLFAQSTICGRFGYCHRLGAHECRTHKYDSRGWGMPLSLCRTLCRGNLARRALWPCL